MRLGRRPEGERFWIKVNVNGSIPAHRPSLGRCWVWTASTSNGGYGKFKRAHPGPLVGAHVWAYLSTGKGIPDGHDLDHLCRNPPCVRPDHLEPVTRQVNTLRGESPAARHAKKAHCVNGHPLSGENLAVRLIAGTSRTRRRCRECERAGARRQYYRKAGVRVASMAEALTPISLHTERLDVDSDSERDLVPA